MALAASVFLGIALAHGLAIAIMVSALGHISGGHFNPAVTIGFWVTKRVNTVDTILYWAAQLAGATAAAFLLKAVIPKIPGAPSLWARRNSREIFRAGRDDSRSSNHILPRADRFRDSCRRKRRVPLHRGLRHRSIHFARILVAGPSPVRLLNPARAFGPALRPRTGPITESTGLVRWPEDLSPACSTIRSI